MIDLHPETLPENKILRPKNRVGDFFCKNGNRVGILENNPRVYAGENRLYVYDACRGVSLSQSEQLKPSTKITREGSGTVLGYVYKEESGSFFDFVNKAKDTARFIRTMFTGESGHLGGDLIVNYDSDIPQIDGYEYVGSTLVGDRTPIDSFHYQSGEFTSSALGFPMTMKTGPSQWLRNFNGNLSYTNSITNGEINAAINLHGIDASRIRSIGFYKTQLRHEYTIKRFK